MTSLRGKVVLLPNNPLISAGNITICKGYKTIISAENITTFHGI